VTYRNCTHIDITTVQQYHTKSGRQVRILECDNCGRVFKEVDAAIRSNFPTVSYYAHLSS